MGLEWYSKYYNYFKKYLKVLTATLGPSKGCGGPLKAVENEWKKLNVPIDPQTENYYPNLRCEWNIEVKIKLSFNLSRPSTIFQAERGNLIEIRLIELKLEQKPPQQEQQQNSVNSTLANYVGLSFLEVTPCFDYIAIYDGPKVNKKLFSNLLQNYF